MKSVVAGVAIIAGALCVTHQARAWCRTTTCDQLNPPPSCGVANPNACSTEGNKIAWPNTCVSTSVSASGSPLRNITAAKMREIVQAAFEQWTTTQCSNGHGHPSFVVDMFPDVNCTEVTGDNGYKSTGPNYNVWIFRDNDWPYDTTDENAIAITTTQFSPDTGVIYDSDVELNSKGQDFTTTSPPETVGMDLASVVQHEAGHFLGLAHSQNPSATMYPSLGTGDISRRALSSDDIDGICATYPPERPLDDKCDPEPRHGFSTECTLPANSCCTIAPGRVNRAHRVPECLIIAAFFGIGVARRRRRPSGRE